MGLGLGQSLSQTVTPSGVVLPDSLGDMKHFFQHETGITTSSDRVTNWEDQIGTANLVQTTVNRQPLYDSTTGGINFTVAETSANSNRLEFSSLQSFTGAFSLYFLVELEDFTSGTLIFHGFTAGGTLSSTDSTINFFDNTSTLSNTFFQMVLSGAASGSSSSSISVATNPDPLHDTKSLVVITCSDTDGGTVKAYFGGNDTNSDSINEASSSSLSGDKAFDIKIIGHHSGSPQRQMGAKLFEWGSYEKELSSSQVTELFNIMNNRELIG
tara:strand:+ start:87 stop:896 length:810 start_codon:yes stop_codon:yes gene_type:complete